MPTGKRDAHFRAVDAYIQKHYQPPKAFSVIDALGGTLRNGTQHASGGAPSELVLQGILDAVMSAASRTFAEQLIILMERSGEKPASIYAKAGITKQHFSKIKNNADYKPTKETALAFAIALHLSLPETKDLIGRAGFTLSPSSKRDLIVEYFIKEKIYDVDEINYNLNVRGFGTLTNRRNIM